MSLDSLADSQAVVWLPSPDRPSTGARGPRSLYSRGTLLWLAVVDTAQSRERSGPGLRDTAQRKGISPDTDTTVPQNAILEIVSGARTGEVWQVISAERPRGRLLEMVLAPWSAPIPKAAGQE